MSVADLVALRDKVQAELSRKIDVERNALQKQIAALSNLENGTSTKPNGGDVVHRRRKNAGGGKASKGRAAKAGIGVKFQGPNGETWSGRGRTPRWLTALEAEGKKRDSFLVAK